MKKVISTPAVLLLLTLFLSAGCTDKNISPSKGIVSPAGLNSGARTELNGEWELYWNRFYIGDEFNTEEAVAGRKYIEYRTNWNSAVINGWHVPEYGYATYRLIIKVPENTPDHIYLRIPYYDMSVNIFCNSRMIFYNGNVGTNTDSSRTVSYYPYVTSVTPEKGIIELVIHASNFRFPRGGVRHSIILGSRDSIIRFNDITTSVEMIFIGILIFMFFYNMVLFILMKREYLPLYLGLLCLSAAVHMMVNGTSLLGKMGVTWEPLCRIHYISWIAAIHFLYRYFTMMIDEYRFRMISLTHTALSVILSIIILSTPIEIFNYVYYPIMVTYLLTIAYSITVSFIAYRRRLDNSVLFLLSFVVITLLVIIDSIPAVSINQFNATAPAGIIFFCFIHSVTIGRELKTYIKNNKILTRDLGRKNIELEEINRSLERIVIERTDELKKNNIIITEQNRMITEINLTLEERIKKAIDELRLKDDILTINARQASMGEMIGFIGHQWKQNIYAISLYTEALKNLLNQKGILSSETADEPLEKIDTFIIEMYRTLNDFSDFIKPGKDVEYFSITGAIEETLLLMRDFITINSIEIVRDYRGEPSITGFSNELKQVVINLIKNSIDAFDERAGNSRIIVISVFRDDGISCIRVKDNAGGIQLDKPGEVFEKFYTSKKSGTGLGLYLSKIVIEQRFNGTITVRNTEDGAEFSISIPVFNEDTVL